MVPTTFSSGAVTAFADAWPRAIETEIGAALCAIGAGKDFNFGVIAVKLFRISSL